MAIERENGRIRSISMPVRIDVFQCGMTAFLLLVVLKATGRADIGWAVVLPPLMVAVGYRIVVARYLARIRDEISSAGREVPRAR